MDTDVELIRSIDAMLPLGCFIGFQHEQFVSNGLIVGAEPHNAFIQENASVYETFLFKSRGQLQTDSLPRIYNKYSPKYGLIVPDTGKIQIVNGVHVFPSEYFAHMTTAHSK